MSDPARTAPPHLRLHVSEPASWPSGRHHLAPNPVLKAFLSTAATAGVGSTQAAELAVERALVLLDGQGLGLDVERVRSTLNQAAYGARVTGPLGPQAAGHLWALSGQNRAVAESSEDGLTVELPERLLIRLRPGILPDCLTSRAVAEMVNWERAAVLEGRSMSEWAALSLAAAVRR
jgi:hypothetical protein